MYHLDSKMKNLSINSESIEVIVDKLYYIIDALYLNDIKNAVLLNHVSIVDIRKEVFPYTDTPFAEFKTKNNIFSVNRIKKVDYEAVVTEDYSFFSTDTGLILLISEDIFIEFLNDYNYDLLVNSDYELINENYWKSITSKFNVEDVGLILSSSNSENDFDGSGTYRIA
jgi:hypothetical protein